MVLFQSEYINRHFIITGHDARVVLKGYEGPLSGIQAPRLLREMIARGSNLVALRPEPDPAPPVKKTRKKKTTV